MTRDEVVNHFQQYGPIKSCVLLTHKDSGKSKGCAMILYHKWAHAGGRSDMGQAVIKHGAQGNQQSGV